jgi:ATP adenylyltransferase
MSADCIFCGQSLIGRAQTSTDFFLTIRDAYPVTEGHTLVIPKRHVAKLSELNELEKSKLLEVVLKTQADLQQGDETICGFNIGVNEGLAAGQTIFHLHVHIIPRRDGDVEDPRGGVRGVIPSKQRYS